MGQRFNRFLDYISDVYYDNFYWACKSYAIKDKERLILARLSSDISKVYEIDVEELSFKTVYIEDKGNKILFDVAIEPRVSFHTYSARNKDHDVDELTLNWVQASCGASIEGENLRDFQIYGIDDFNKYKPHKPLNGNLVPIIYSNEYDKYAEELLRKYYPEALELDKNINPNELAKKMGLTVIHRSITKDGTIFGESFFKETEATFYDFASETFYKETIKPKTVVVDDAANTMLSLGSNAITIVHECLHFYLHEKAFEFARIYNKDLTYISCRSEGEEEGSSDDMNKWMEIQANGIAPHVLMPKDKFKKATDNYIYIESLVADDYWRAVIDDLARDFGVTRYAAKKRMLDLGYYQVGGVYNYVDDGYVKDYFYKSDSLIEGETYAISRKDLNILINKSSELLGMLFGGGYVFVENHIVIDDEEYVIHSSDGVRLTLYARKHLDECAIKFRVVSSSFNVKAKSFLAFCYLCRELIPCLTFELSLANNEKLESSEKLKKKRQYYNEAINEIRVGFITNKTFGSRLSFLMNYAGITQQDLEDESGVPIRMIRRYINDGVMPQSINNVIALSVALNLPPKISSSFITSSGLAIPEDEYGTELLCVITTMYNCPIPYINKYLKSMGQRPLIDKPDANFPNYKEKTDSK